jgi:sigma-B regulation protein RsbU (phosphoserine phosphatase)
MQEMLRQMETLGALQRHLLPRKLPQPVGWHLAAHYTVGLWPGGDYYDLLPLPDGRLLLVVADASDQGAPSAALVAMTRVILRSCPLSSGIEQLPFCPFREPVLQPPHILLGHLNRVLAENSLQEQFLTLFCGVLDTVDGNFHYANAGHPAPRWWRAAPRTVEPIRDAAGLPLGVDRHGTYHHKRIEIEPGDLVVFYTDGLTAALNEMGQTFDCRRLDEAVCGAAGDGAEAVKTAVVARLAEFLDGQHPQDDVALLVVERLG